MGTRVCAVACSLLLLVTLLLFVISFVLTFRRGVVVLGSSEPFRHHPRLTAESKGANSGGWFDRTPFCAEEGSIEPFTLRPPRRTVDDGCSPGQPLASKDRGASWWWRIRRI